MIEETLKNLGLNEKETRVYLTVLEYKKITPSDVARITEINRTTVYSVAKELIKMGMIVEDRGGISRRLMAVPCEDIRDVTKQDELQLKEKNELLEQLLGEIQTHTKRDAGYSIPKITFIPGSEVKKHLRKKAYLWTASALERDGTWWGYQDETFTEHYNKWIDWYWSEVAPQECGLKLLSNESNIEKEMKKKKYSDRRQIKFWKGTKKFTATTWAVGDYVMMITTNEKPHYLIQIHDTNLAHNMRELFKGIWETVTK